MEYDQITNLEANLKEQIQHSFSTYWQSNVNLRLQAIPLITGESRGWEKHLSSG